IGAAALVVSACKDSTAPQLSNPQQLGSDLQIVSSVFDSPAFRSFGALDSAPGSPVAASTPAGALLSAASVAAPQTPRQPYADAPARLQAFRTTAVGFVTDGTRRIDFNATFSATNLATDNPDAHAVVHWALNNPALTIDLDEKVDTPNANEATITIDFTYAHAGETVHLTGTVTVV